MIDKSGMQLQHLESCIEPEPTYYMQQQQSLAKVLSPGRYQHGVSRNKLINYSYDPGELIVCNRGIDEFVRWNSAIRILKVDLPLGLCSTCYWLKRLVDHCLTSCNRCARAGMQRSIEQRRSSQVCLPFSWSCGESSILGSRTGAAKVHLKATCSLARPSIWRRKRSQPAAKPSATDSSDEKRGFSIPIAAYEGTMTLTAGKSSYRKTD